jgi:hypothetical protein
MELCCTYMNMRMSLTEIGRELGNVSVAALSHNNRRLRERMDSDKTAERLYEEVKKRVDQP